METHLPVNDGAPARVPVLTLVSKASCHLCHAAREVVAGVTGELGLPWTEVSIDDDAALAERFAEEIPVVLVDGVQRDFWKIDPVRLRTVLRAAMAAPGPRA
ncbi:glutaredoxin family protein [Pseudarthrobacter sp. P1]|uniref:glutaredoxin family protein n=1 Tax=Pseudarthrobacter sp. P1 TaxID=3418418 RepID=UPI003CF79B27